MLTNRRGADAFFGPQPDFRAVFNAIQQRALEATPLGLAAPPAGEQARFEDGVLLFRGGGGDAYAVALARVRGIAETPVPKEDDTVRRTGPFAGSALSGLYGEGASFLHLLFGHGSEVRLYAGVKAFALTPGQAAQQAVSAFRSFKACYASTYPGIALHDLTSAEEFQAVLARLQPMHAAVSLVGNPSLQEGFCQEESTGDRLIRALRGSEYALVVEGVPIEMSAVSEAFQRITAQVAEAHRYVKRSTSGAAGAITSESFEQLDRFAQHCEELLEAACQRIDAGFREGMWRTCLTGLTTNDPDARRLSSLLRSVFAGKDSKPEPIKTLMHQNPAHVMGFVRAFQSPRAETGPTPYIHAFAFGTGPLETPLTSSELGLLADLPHKEAPGYHVGWLREFAVDVEARSETTVKIGAVLGSAGPTQRVFALPLGHLTRHGLVAGLTGSGKTTTLFGLLDQLWCTHQVPFLVLEPAKAQYRHLLADPRFDALSVFAPGLGRTAPLFLNPFEFSPGIDPGAHIANLYTVFNAAFILYAPMPYVLERALYEVYEDRGWELSTGLHPDADPETGAVPSLAFPTLTDLYGKIGEVVERLGYDKKIEMDVRAGLQARVDSLRVGQKGQTFDCRRSVPFQELLSQPTIIELSHIGSDDEKAFLMGLLLMRLYETRLLSGDFAGLRHVTVVEEAHRLLARASTETSAAEVANVKGKAVEAFCNILAEIRSYGEGLIVAEQIPSKLAEDVIKNTNLKIMHRIVAADDREILGSSMNLTEDQQRVVTALTTGEAVVFAEGNERPALVRVPPYDLKGTTSDEAVNKNVRRYYRDHAEVLMQAAGCEHCSDVCRYRPKAKRLADDVRFQSSVWGYTLTCLDTSETALQRWGEAETAMLADASVYGLTDDERGDLAWCVFVTAAEAAFWTLHGDVHAVSLRDLESFLKAFADMAASARRQDGGAFAANRKTMRSAANRILSVPEGPFPGCAACAQQCLYGPLARLLINRKDLRDGLSKTLDAKKDAAVVAYCDQIAAKVLFGASPSMVRGVAICFYVQMANRMGVPDPSRFIQDSFVLNT